jgi:L-fuculose-phosphate aldolase
MNFHLLHPRDQLVTIMHRIYHSGMTTLSGGNLSIRDENGDIWITPAGVDKGKLTADEIMCVGAGGGVRGPYRPSSELPFHRAIYEQRPDLHAVVHAHAPALVSYSIARKVPPTNIIPQAQNVCGTVGYAPYALPGSEELGQAIAATFAGGYNVILLQNHGTATGGPDLLSAFQRLETLDFCARTLIKAQALGPVQTLSAQELALIGKREYLLPEFTPDEHSSRERELRAQMIDAVQRAYDRSLMISTQGVVSARVDDKRFLITPTGKDRRNLDIEDIVLIDKGRREAGKAPSRSVRLHEAIYRRQPHLNTIITAQPPNATAYAITGTTFDSHTIPETYIMLRDVPLVPFGAQYTAPEEIAGQVSPRTPVLLIENDCVLVAGSSVLEAFDRLEVLEFSARALLDTAAIGPVAPIGDEDIEALKGAFGL